VCGVWCVVCGVCFVLCVVLCVMYYAVYYVLCDVLFWAYDYVPFVICCFKLSPAAAAAAAPSVPSTLCLYLSDVGRRIAVLV
jgi:hypothetical protein